MHVQTLVVLRAVRQRLEHPLRAHADVGHLAAVAHGRGRGRIWLAGGVVGFGFDGGGVEGPAREVEVHVRGFEEVLGDLHFVGDGADDVGADVAFVVEGLEAAPDVGVVVFGEFGFWGIGGIGGRGVDVDPLFDFDGAGAVVEFVGDVGGLGGDVADLADEGDLVRVVLVGWFLGVGVGGGTCTCIISTSSILNSPSSCGWRASRICFMVTGLRVSLPYVGLMS